MKLLFLLLAVLPTCIVAFAPPTAKTTHTTSTSQIAMTTNDMPKTATPLIDMPGIKTAKHDLITTCERLKDEYGTFLIDKKAKQDLTKVVEELENLSEVPSFHNYKDELIGDWDLVCTTASSKTGVDTSQLPFFDIGPLKQIRDSIRKTTNKYLKVQQRIRSTDDADKEGEIDRIDHIIQYQPPKELRDVLDNLPDPLKDVNINPLSVSKSKLILVHRASLESEMPLKISLSLKSVVLNIAGSSQFLDPNGADLAALNVPLGELLNAGTFETTYIDDEVRISRGRIAAGNIDQLRVFVKSGKLERDSALKEILDSDIKVGKGVDADLDVDELVDPEFATDNDETEKKKKKAPTSDVDDSSDPEFEDEKPSDVNNDI